MLPICVINLILSYMNEMNEFTDLPQKFSIFRLVQASDMFVLDTIEKVSRTLAGHVHRDYYCLKVRGHMQYYFVLSPIQKIKLYHLLQRAMYEHSATSRMMWVFLDKGLYKHDDYGTMFEKSLLVMLFAKVLHVSPLVGYPRIL